jgi:hypothetical protein
MVLAVVEKAAAEPANKRDDERTSESFIIISMIVVELAWVEAVCVGWTAV